jgi:hypothetical protein
MKILILLFMLLSLGLRAAPTPLPEEDPFEKIFEEQQKRMKAMMDDDFMKDWEKSMEDMRKAFGPMQKHFNKAFGPKSPFGEFWNKMLGPQIEGEWKETDKERILLIKVDAKNNKYPLEIKVQDGQVTASGKIEEKEEQTSPQTQGPPKKALSHRVYSFTQNFSIPADVDDHQAVVESKGKDGIWVRFPKLADGAQKSRPASKGPKKQNAPVPALTPLAPGSGDTLI